MLRNFVISSLSLFLVAACAGSVTPEKAYYAANEAYIVTLRVAVEYKATCNTRRQDDPCKSYVKRIQDAVKRTDRAFDVADRVFLTKSTLYYRLAISDAENALANLKKLLTEAYNG